MQKFNRLYLTLLKEAEEDSDDELDAPPDVGGEEDAPLDVGGEGLPEEMNVDDMPDEMMGEEPKEEVNPEEIELAKVAVRALYFNLDSKDVHQYKLKYKDRIIPFEKLPDFFEETKRWRPVLAFVEFLMDKFEGTSSRWAEEDQISGLPIVKKIQKINKDVPEEEQLDDARRLYWARIILNCMLFGKPTENMNIGDVTARNLKEVYNWLKLHYGVDTRGIMAGKDYIAPGVA